MAKPKGLQWDGLHLELGRQAQSSFILQLFRLMIGSCQRGMSEGPTSVVSLSVFFCVFLAYLIAHACQQSLANVTSSLLWASVHPADSEAFLCVYVHVLSGKSDPWSNASLGGNFDELSGPLAHTDFS